MIFSSDGRSLFLALFGPSTRIERLDLATGKSQQVLEAKLADPVGVYETEVQLAKDARSYLMCGVRRLDTLHVLEFPR